MKVLQINKFFYHESGVTRYLFSVRQLLAQAGHKPMEFSMKHPKNVSSPYAPYFSDYVDYNNPGGLLAKMKIGLRLTYSFNAKRQLKKLILAEKPDIAHLHVIYHQLSPSILGVLKKYNIPIVQTLHDYKQICPNYLLYVNEQVCERCKKHKYYHSLIHRCIKKSFIRSLNGMAEAYLHWFLKSYSKIDLYIAPSRFIEKKYGEFGVPQKKIKYLPHFLDLKEYDLASKTGDYLVYFGRLAKEKGINLLLKALAKADPNIPLKIIGEGPEKENVKKSIKELKLKNVELVGFKTGQELKKLITNSLAVVVPSLWYENAPFSVYESMALGKAVIGSDLGGIPELVEDQATGWLFKAGSVDDLASKIKIAANSPAKAEKFGQKAKEIAQEKFSALEHLKKLFAIYQKLIKQDERA